MSELLRGAMNGVNFASNLVHRQYQYDQNKIRDGERKEDRRRSIERQSMLDDRYEQDRSRGYDRQTMLDDRYDSNQERKYKREDAQDSLTTSDRARRYKREDAQDKTAAVDRKSRIKREDMQAQLYKLNLDNAKDQKNAKAQIDALSGFKAYLGGNLSEENSAVILKALNTAFSSIINQGDGGTKEIVDITPAAEIQPGAEGLVVELEVDPGKGKKKYRAPLTQGASTDPDDPIQIFEEEDLFDVFTTMEASLRDSGYGQTIDEMNRMVDGRVRALGGGNLEKGSLGRMEAEYGLKTNLEKMKNENRLGQIAATAKAKEKSSSKPTGQVQVVNWLMENVKGPNGGPLSADEAWAMAQTAKSNPEKAVQSMFESLMEAQDQALMFGEVENKLSPQQMADKAKNLVQMLREDSQFEAAKGGGSSGTTGERDELDMILDEAGAEDYR